MGAMSLEEWNYSDELNPHSDICFRQQAGKLFDWMGIQVLVLDGLPTGMLMLVPPSEIGAGFGNIESIMKLDLYKVRQCNRHDDCDVADEAAKAKGFPWGASHCHDECCEECFGY